MDIPIILASSSDIRAQMLRQAGIRFTILPARLDEQAITDSLLAQQASAREIADALAAGKAQKISAKHPEACVIGADQVLEHNKQLLEKPESPEIAAQQLRSMAGAEHRLHSAVVVYQNASPVWRHIGTVRVTMRKVSEGFLDSYVSRNWDSIRHSVGAYKIEEEGARLIERIEGDYFTVLGMPLLPLIGYLSLQGIIEA